LRKALQEASLQRLVIALLTDGLGGLGEGLLDQLRLVGLDRCAVVALLACLDHLAREDPVGLVNKRRRCTSCS